MPKILSIETSTALCSVALSSDGEVVASRSDENRQHASLTAVFCDEVLREAGLRACDLDAVCISEGPGSYTGLRVGLSTAKGLCLGGGVKLLSVCSLDELAAMAGEEEACVVPMIDARRMEVYTAVYAPGVKRLTPVEAKIIESGAFADIAPGAVFIGDGALKCREAIGCGRFVEAFPQATAMAPLAEREYAASAFRDVAYFTPFYLKDFVATTSRKKLF